MTEGCGIGLAIQQHGSTGEGAGVKLGGNHSRRMDTSPKFIQPIKQVQQEIGVGCARVRPPRLEVTGTELQETCAAVQPALQHRPSVNRTAFPK